MAESKTVNATNYRTLVVPLWRINQKYSDIMKLLPVDGDATIVAARAVFETLFGLFNASDDEKWQRARERLCIGLVKDTKDFGNTSVSQGCAVEYFTKNPDENMVTFLNCGTGGIKYQVYERKPNGVITPKSEYKPKDGASPQHIACPGYRPKSPVDINVEQNQLKCEMAAASIPEGCCVFAFVTGKIRASWESGNSNTRSEIEAAVTKFFSADTRITPCTPGTFFLTQDREGALELLGTDSMYENLAMAGELPKSVRTIATFGIGRGSVQLTWESSDRAHQHPMNTTPGMDDELGLSTLPRRLMPGLRSNLGMIIDYMGDYGQPTIALKSGCMLYLNSTAGKPLLDLLIKDDSSASANAVVDSQKNAIIMAIADMSMGFIPMLASLVKPDDMSKLVELENGLETTKSRIRDMYTNSAPLLTTSPSAQDLSDMISRVEQTGNMTSEDVAMLVASDRNFEVQVHTN